MGVMLMLIFLPPSQKKRLESVTCSTASQKWPAGDWGLSQGTDFVPGQAVFSGTCTPMAPKQQVPGVSAQRRDACCAPPHASAAPAEPNAAAAPKPLQISGLQPSVTCLGPSGDCSESMLLPGGH